MHIYANLSKVSAKYLSMVSYSTVVYLKINLYSIPFYMFHAILLREPNWDMTQGETGEQQHGVHAEWADEFRRPNVWSLSCGLVEYAY